MRCLGVPIDIPTARRPADFRLLRHAEHLIASAIGAASSRLVLSLLLKQARRSQPTAALKLLDDAHTPRCSSTARCCRPRSSTSRQGVSVFDPELQADHCGTGPSARFSTCPPVFCRSGFRWWKFDRILRQQWTARGECGSG
jgi:hypothetical protein